MKWTQVIEALLFSSPKGLTAHEILLALQSEQVSTVLPSEPAPTTVHEVERLLEQLSQLYNAHCHAFELVCVNNRWQLLTRPEYGPWVNTLVGEKPRPGRLTTAALETLTIIAYRQPITRAEIEEIRGVSVDGVLQSLLDRGLIKVVGKAELPGRPLLYGTTDLFLEAFGLRDLNDLPDAPELKAYLSSFQTDGNPNLAGKATYDSSTLKPNHNENAES